MPYLSQRSSEFLSPSEKENPSENLSAYTFRSDRGFFREDVFVDFRNTPHPSRKQGFSEDSDIKSGSIRLQGGHSTLPACKYKPPASLISACTGKKRGLSSPKPTASVAVVHVQLNASIKGSKFGSVTCPGDQRKRKRNQTRGTQTLYRESSAQTIPYLPGVKDDIDGLDRLELFKLPTILPGDGPPGLYEVEVLERARKRWAFTKALKETFRRQLETSKEPLAPQKNVMEAFEWERWMEREERIQHCQMLRLELVMRMFEKREKQMHESSQSRIEFCCSQITAKREEALRKNEIEYGRQIRRLEIKRRNAPRTWRKEKISSLLGDSSSEFYAPQMRYGVNPNRRHYVAERKAFEARMKDLEKKAVNMNLLVCPFAKLKEWSKPKRGRMEVEQNFCSDSNLKKLYEALTNLRQQSSKHKAMPKCLKEKLNSGKTEQVETLESERNTLDLEPVERDGSGAENSRDMRKGQHVTFEENQKSEEDAFRKQVNRDKEWSMQLMSESRTEELEAMLTEYEGSTIGWLMRFLSDEMNRLQEQRNLHYFTMLAQKERWRREAAEAGLRQKENEMREIYEQIFQLTNEANAKTCSEYLSATMDFDTRDYAEQTATNSITELAKVIDSDIQRWLDSLRSIQNPLNYQMLRHMLKDLIFPNADVLAKRFESELVVEGLINDFLFPHVEKMLESYDISFTIANDMVDRLTDNDLYIFSDDSSVSSSGGTLQEREAHAILRKLIRRGVPGRRWMIPPERIANECIGDVLDDILNQILNRETCQLDEQQSFIDLLETEHKADPESSDPDSERMTLFMQSILINPYSVNQSTVTSPIPESTESAAIEHDSNGREEQPGICSIDLHLTQKDGTGKINHKKEMFEDVLGNDGVVNFYRSENVAESGEHFERPENVINYTMAPKSIEKGSTSIISEDEQYSEDLSFEMENPEQEDERVTKLRSMFQSERERKEFILEMIRRGEFEIRGSKAENSIQDLSIETFEYDGISVVSTTGVEKSSHDGVTDQQQLPHSHTEISRGIIKTPSGEAVEISDTTSAVEFEGGLEEAAMYDAEIEDAGESSMEEEVEEAERLEISPFDQFEELDQLEEITASAQAVFNPEVQEANPSVEGAASLAKTLETVSLDEPEALHDPGGNNEGTLAPIIDPSETAEAEVQQVDKSPPNVEQGFELHVIENDAAQEE